MINKNKTHFAGNTKNSWRYEVGVVFFNFHLINLMKRVGTLSKRHLLFVRQCQFHVGLLVSSGPLHNAPVVATSIFTWCSCSLLKAADSHRIVTSLIGHASSKVIRITAWSFARKIKGILFIFWVLYSSPSSAAKKQLY